MKQAVCPRARHTWSFHSLLGSVWGHCYLFKGLRDFMKSSWIKFIAKWQENFCWIYRIIQNRISFYHSKYRQGFSFIFNSVPTRILNPTFICIKFCFGQFATRLQYRFLILCSFLLYDSSRHLMFPSKIPFVLL